MTKTIDHFQHQDIWLIDVMLTSLPHMTPQKEHRLHIMKEKGKLINPPYKEDKHLLYASQNVFIVNYKRKKIFHNFDTFFIIKPATLLKKKS